MGVRVFLGGDDEGGCGWVGASWCRPGVVGCNANIDTAYGSTIIEHRKKMKIENKISNQYWIYVNHECK